MHKILKIIFHRTFIITMMILLQVAWFASLFFRFTEYSNIANSAFKILSVFVVFYVANGRSNSAAKIAWIIVILLFPLFGGLLYLYTGDKHVSKPLMKRLRPSIEEGSEYLRSDGIIEKEVKKINGDVAGEIHYLEQVSGYRAWKDSKVTYYSSGENAFPIMLEELRKAKEYIFLEYFIIEEGIMWNSILEILEQKVKEGVDVRVIYDDVGSIFVLPWHYDNILKEKGIPCVVFNRYVPMASTIFNNRDHRKILVIDGKTAFTGGINLADEYINEKQRFGYWKDNVVQLKGRAVYNMTAMFLQMWNAFSMDKMSYERYLSDDIEPVESDGVVLPFSDNPLDNETVGENVYLNMINHAKKYIYFFTPYLIIDNEISTALTLAAKRGVDVKIITPGIPDKKMVFLVTQSYYEQLVDGGVQIYQYRSGFVHGKVAVSDDVVATVGTINLDYRSLYLHFENGVYMYESSAIKEIKQDFLDALKDSTYITKEICQKKVFFRFLQGLLRILSPLL